MGRPLRFVVVIPARNEEQLLPRTLAGLAAQDYPAELVDTVVVADNCSDETAAVARSAGVQVLERTDPLLQGRGWALDWAIQRLPESYDALLVLDADCVPSPNLVASASAYIRAGADATQSDYVVSNTAASPAAALRGASFALLSRIRARGKDRLGLSSGLFGTGMAFRREVVAAHRWRGDALDDAFEFHFDLVDAGSRVRFTPEAHVSSPMPTTAAASFVQQRRWEAGRRQGIQRWFPRLVRRGIRERDPARLHAAFDALVPPQSIVAALSTVTLAAAVGLGSPRLARLACFNLGAQAVFVVGGLLAARSPRAAYAGLIFAPVLVAQKLGIYARLASGERVPWLATPRV